MRKKRSIEKLKEASESLIEVLNKARETDGLSATYNYHGEYFKTDLPETYEAWLREYRRLYRKAHRYGLTK